MKREGISTLFIHDFPLALSYLLDHLLLFESVFVMWVLKVILKRVFFVMALVSIRTRTKCCLLKMVQRGVCV